MKLPCVQEIRKKVATRNKVYSLKMALVFVQNCQNALLHYNKCMYATV